MPIQKGFPLSEVIKVLETKIEVLNFSERSYIRLKEMPAKTVGEVVVLRPKMLRSGANFGLKSYKEIEITLKSLDSRLGVGMTVEDELLVPYNCHRKVRRNNIQKMP